MTDETTAVAKREDRSFSELVVAGANLSPEEWDSARIAAARKMLPTRFQDVPSTIAYLARAQRSGLDPFMNELWAWEDKRGNLTFMTARDGWLKIAKRDPQVDGIEFGLVYENDEFTVEMMEGHAAVHHSWSFPRGNLMGAYCAVHMREDRDHVDFREMSDYSHLRGKDNWKNHPKDMLLTRVISVTVRLKCPAGAGIYSPEDFEMEQDAGQSYESFGAPTDARADALAAELETEEAVEVEATEAGEAPGPEPEPESEPADASGETPPETSDEGGTDEAEESMPAPEASDSSGAPSDETEPSTSDETEDEPSDTEEPSDPDTEPCPYCAKPIAPRSRGGHIGGHSRSGDVNDAAKLAVENGWSVVDEVDGDGFYVIDPDGVLHGVGKNDNSFSDWTFAVKAMGRLFKEGSPDLFAEDEDADPRADAPETEAHGRERVEEAQEILPDGATLHEQEGHFHVTGPDGHIVENPAIDGPGGRSYADPVDAAEIAVHALSGTDDEPDEVDEEEEVVEDWEDAYTALIVTMKKHDRGTDSALLYDVAEDLFPTMIDPKKGRVRVTELSAAQLQELHDTIRERLEDE